MKKLTERHFTLILNISTPLSSPLHDISKFGAKLKLNLRKEKNREIYESERHFGLQIDHDTKFCIKNNSKF